RAPERRGRGSARHGSGAPGLLDGLRASRRLGQSAPRRRWHRRRRRRLGALAELRFGATSLGNTEGVDGQALQFRLRGGSDAVPAVRGVLDRLAEEYELPSFGDLRLLISELFARREGTVIHLGCLEAPAI